MTDAVEFVNDWSELEKSLAVIKAEDFNDPDLGEWDCSGPHMSWEAEDALTVITQYVPRLLTQYASLLETSFALVEGWEAYAQVNKPSGLFVPDHR